MKFGEYLRKCREVQGLSLRKAAVQIDLPHTYLYQVELGDRKPIDPSKWEELMRAMPSIKEDRLKVLYAREREILIDASAVSDEEIIDIFELKSFVESSL